MDELQHLEMFANKLHQEDPPPIISVPWHARHPSHFQAGGDGPRSWHRPLGLNEPPEK